ncbi:uncharacterized protein RJT20DRAFT_54766 [Scheffersomyces xylosifermentans]|uniref:uncharacterized protein n=1 Tax=Scheffersomyces xylosifermentans TaxID=1304137 RepID=UPI00315DD4D6
MSSNKVLLIGATGFIGRQAALRFRRNNYTVYGLARSDEKAVTLLKEELIPIASNTGSTEYLDQMVELGIHTVIDFSGTPTSTHSILDKLEEIVTEEKHAVNFVYISGIWVHGDSLDAVDETVKPVESKVAQLVKYRVGLEERIVGLKDVIPSIIIRPGILCGTNSPIWGALFGQILAAVLQGDTSTISLALKENLTSGLIHNEDVAEIIFQAVENFDVASSKDNKLPIFDIVADNVSFPELVKKGAKLLGFKGEISLEGKPSFEENAFLNAFNTSVVTNSKHATEVFGWKPKIPIVDNFELLLNTWAVNQNQDYYTRFIKK